MHEPDEELRTLLEIAGRFLKTQYRLPHHEEEDLQQEITLAVAKALKRAGPIECREAYTRAIARNVVATYFRRKKHVLSLDELRQYEDEPGDPRQMEAPPEKLLREENARFLYQALASLSDEYQRVLFAVYIERLEAAQVAQLEGIKPKTVYTRLARAESQLRQVLKRRFSTLYAAHAERSQRGPKSGRHERD